MFKRIMLLVLAMAVTGCANLQQLMKENIKEPEVAYKSISVGQLTSDKIELKPTFSITNKNSYTIPVDSLKYELSFNQKTMINGETDKIGDLPASQSKDITLGIDLTKDTLLSVKDVLLKEGQIDYVIKGEVEVMGFRFPFEKVSTLYKPSVSIGKLEIKKSSFNQIEMVHHIWLLMACDFLTKEKF
jgi:LEA14-like dessication related protein